MRKILSIGSKISGFFFIRGNFIKLTAIEASIKKRQHKVFEKSQKKSHSTLRAKRVTFTKVKNAKNGPFWRVFENLKLAVKQCYKMCQS